MSLSLRAYAAHRRAAGLPGGSLQAVQKAVETGRLSLDDDGKIGDASAADREWFENTSESRRPASAHAVDRTDSAPAARALAPLQQARLRVELARARTAEIELAKLEGRYVDLQVIRGELVKRNTIVKMRLLAVPTQIAQRISAPDDLRRHVFLIATDLVHEALTELSDDAAYRDVVPDGGVL